MVQPTVPRENRKMLALPEDQIFISILCVSALIPGGCLVQFLQQSRCKSSWYRKSDRKAVGTALLQQEREREAAWEEDWGAFGGIPDVSKLRGAALSATYGIKSQQIIITASKSKSHLCNRKLPLNHLSRRGRITLDLVNVWARNLTNLGRTRKYLNARSGQEGSLIA